MLYYVYFNSYPDFCSNEQINKLKGSVIMFDSITIIACFLFYVLSTLLSDNVCQFELTYLDEYKNKDCFNPRYVLKKPVLAFSIIALFNFISIFWVADKVQFFAYALIQIFITILGIFTYVHKRIFPKSFDIIACILSTLLLIGIILINVL